jgi:hypothetical protein
MTEIGLALGVDPRLVSKWRERSKLPPADAVLSVGPIWLGGTIEPWIAGGGPRPKSTGSRMTAYKITCRMTMHAMQATTGEQRERFERSLGEVRRVAHQRWPGGTAEMLWSPWAAPASTRLVRRPQQERSS